MNDATLNMLQVFLWTYFQFSLVYTWDGITESCGNFMFNFLGYCPIVLFKVASSCYVVFNVIYDILEEMKEKCIKMLIMLLDSPSGKPDGGRSLLHLLFRMKTSKYKPTL